MALSRCPPDPGIVVNVNRRSVRHVSDAPSVHRETEHSRRQTPVGGRMSFVLSIYQRFGLAM